MEISKITRSEFEQWLSSKTQDEIVGITAHPSGCPVANYLYEKTGIKYSVAPSVVLGEINYEPTPSWMEKFIRMIDANPSGKEVTAAQCLQLLRFH